MSTVDEIRARWEAVQTPVVQGLKMPPQAAHEAFVDNADDDIAYLLAENQRLQTIVEMAQGIVAIADTPQLARNWATDMLRQALAALEGGS